MPVICLLSSNASNAGTSATTQSWVGLSQRPRWLWASIAGKRARLTVWLSVTSMGRGAKSRSARSSSNDTPRFLPVVVSHRQPLKHIRLRAFGSLPVHSCEELRGVSLLVECAVARRRRPEGVGMTISVGTLRGLQQIATPGGVFTIAAMDQRTALKRLLNPSGDLSYAEIRALKIDVTRALSPHASGMLLDPEFGAAECVATGALTGHCGLIVAVEVSGYTTEGTGRLATLVPGWSVAKIKRMGAQAAKILIYYHPDEVQAARKQRDLVARVLEDCRTWDLPLLVETVTYPLAGQDAATFAASKPGVVVRTAEELAPLGFDILKAEFPVDFAFFADESRRRRVVPETGRCLPDALDRAERGRGYRPVRAAGGDCLQKRRFRLSGGTRPLEGKRADPGSRGAAGPPADQSRGESAALH